MIETRRAGPRDIDALLAHLQAGFDSYVAFAPSGWRPPDVQRERPGSVELLADEATWALLALDGQRPVGHVAFYPARERPTGEPSPPLLERPLIEGLVHFWQLFVTPEWWGRGVAPLLHDAAAVEMRARNYESARLFTPSEHARARRFYERRRWSPVGEEHHDELDLTLTEYTLDLRR